MSKVPNVQTWLRDWKEGLPANVVAEKLALVGCRTAEVYDNVFNTGNDSLLTVFGPPGISVAYDSNNPFSPGEELAMLGGDWDLHWDGTQFWARVGADVQTSKSRDWMSLKDAIAVWDE